MIPITRISDQSSGYETETPDRLPKPLKAAITALDVARLRQQSSIIEQINGVLGKKPRYANVSDAVNDMRERTGLNSYLNQVKSSNSNSVQKNAKFIAAQIMGTIPASLKKYYNIEEILSFVDNIISNSNGLGVIVPQLQEDITRTFPNVQSEDVENDEVSTFLNNKITEAQSMLGPPEKNPNLGKNINESNAGEKEDYWAGYMPSKG